MKHQLSIIFASSEYLHRELDELFNWSSSIYHKIIHGRCLLLNEW